MLDKIPRSVLYCLLGMTVMYFLIEIKNKCWIQNDTKRFLNEKIKILVRQTARWSTAAAQDDNPLMGVLHANYGAGFLWALKDIASEAEIEQAAGINMNMFEKAILDTQDKATKKAIRACPSFGPPASYLTTLSGEGI
jgi:hypothetical protein